MLQVHLSVSKHLCHCFINLIPPCVSMEVCETQNIFMKFSLFFIKKSDKDHELCIVCVVCRFIHSQWNEFGFFYSRAKLFKQIISKYFSSSCSSGIRTGYLAYFLDYIILLSPFKQSSHHFTHTLLDYFSIREGFLVFSQDPCYS